MSKHLGDYDASTVIYGKFTTYRPSTGAAYTLGGTPALSVYKDASTTQSTTGVTLTADFDSVTGLNHFAIDTSADGTFYAAGSFFDIVITTGTVDSVSVVGTVVASFTIRKDSALKPTTAGRTLDVSAGGEAGLDWANVGSPTTSVALTKTTILDATRTRDFLEYHRGQHTVAGSTFYVDGVGGNDTTGDGTRATPYKTISKALTVCTSNAHDCIILLPNSGGGPTTITETAAISVTKNYVQIRGPGRDVNVTLNTSGHVFDISASGVQLSGMRITTFSGASSDGVNINSAADFVSVRQCWIENSHRDAVQLNVANNCFIEDCQITNAGRDAVRVSSGAGSGQYNKILRNIIRSAVGVGVNLQGSDASSCRIQNNLIRDCPTGITIASGVSNTSVTDNRFAGNTTNISDSGTGTQHEWNRLATSITDGSVTVGVMNSAVITAASIAADAITDAKVASDVTIASVTGAVGSVTAGVTVTTNNDKTGYALSATGSAAMTEGYAADGAAPTLNQFMYMIWSLLAERSIAGTTLTAKKLDGATTAMEFTLDDATTPTSQTRSL